MDGGGWDSYYNSIQMALLTAVDGTVVVFVADYVVEKTRGFETGRALFQLLAMPPMAIPGMVLGPSNIFFFNDPRHPINAIPGYLANLVVCQVSNFYSVQPPTGGTALKQEATTEDGGD